jgi:hypothetical protein
MESATCSQLESVLRLSASSPRRPAKVDHKQSHMIIYHAVYAFSTAADYTTGFRQL